MNNEIVIKTNKLTKKFGDFIAANELTFEVFKGEIFGFLGANGAGKTTAMKMLIGISKPSSGNANIAGFDVYKETENIKKSIGYMSQKFSLYEDLTVKEIRKTKKTQLAAIGPDNAELNIIESKKK